MTNKKDLLQNDSVFFNASAQLNFRYLEEELKSGKQIVLILGAGIDVGLSWNSFLKPLFEQSLKQVCSEKRVKRDTYKELLWHFSLQDELPKSIVARSMNCIADHINGENPQVNIRQELGRLVDKSGIADRFTAPIKSDFLKATLKDQYLYIVQDMMYRKENRTTIRKDFQNVIKSKQEKDIEYYSLYVIARMIILYPNIVGIITYNYNNFVTEAVLELSKDIFDKEGNLRAKREKINKYQYFNEDETKHINNTYWFRKFLIEDVYGDNLYKRWSRDGVLPIYHVHGYIPPPYEAQDLSGYDIVFSQDEYNETTWGSYSWENSAQAHLMSHYTCLVMGSSFADLSTQRMLHYAQKKNGNKNKFYIVDASNRTDSAEQLLDEIWFDYQEYIGLSPIVGIDFVRMYMRIREAVAGYVSEKNAETKQKKMK